ncbi:unnamed protein product [Brachionus calyciflorus]|uniref:Uncharacterized protein n=1 Tax=Brachionus calyciflorus TaxID=104777 RepID=A0A814GKD8_9BILA|nr:unnamed protein product [Brachionus calyciflorus]
MNIVFWFLLQHSSTYFQAVSRRLCNLSFILYTLFCGTYLFTVLLIITLFITKFWYDRSTSLESLSNQLDESFSFQKIADSKFAGLLIFLISNLLTGLVNITIRTLYTSDFLAVVILCVYTLITFIAPFILFEFLNLKKIKNL